MKNLLIKISFLQASILFIISTIVHYSDGILTSVEIIESLIIAIIAGIIMYHAASKLLNIKK